MAIPPTPAAPHIVDSHGHDAKPRSPSIRYMGFRCTDEGREYTLRVDGEGEPRMFVLAIPHAAFAEKQARFQDAPDVCFAKLQRALVADPRLVPGPLLTLTTADLAEYRELAARRSPERKRRRPVNPNQ